MNHFSLGILGGLGPLASAEFLKTIYEFNLKISEQESPICILYSDPTFPDRTDAILGGVEQPLINLLVKSLESLSQLKVSKIVIACVTMHYFLPKVPVSLREKIISLIDLIVEEVLNKKKLNLLLCTTGARQAGIFQKHEHWNLIERYVLLPDENEQNVLQKYIYQLKTDGDKYSIAEYLNSLASKYQIDSFIAGCTELHLLKKYLMKPDDKMHFGMIDPLMTIAENFTRLMVAESVTGKL